MTSNRLRNHACLVVLTFALFAAFVFCATGCTTTYVRPDGTAVPPAEASLISANDAVTAAYSLIGDARDAGIITQADVDAHADVIKTIDTALDGASAALRQGDEAGVKRWTDAARLALKRLEPLLAKAKR